jgi:hypothetical protein
VDLVGHVPGGQLLAKRGAESLPEVIIELMTGGGHDEQDQPALGAELAGVEGRAVGDLWEPVHHPVELAGAPARRLAGSAVARKR